MNKRGTHPPLVTGHRGAGAERAENTLAAFRHAADIGCDAVELDVHLSADGIPVVVHDSSIRQPNGSVAAVRSLSADELCRVEVADGQCIPRLRDVLELLESTRLGVQIELKGRSVIDATAYEVRRLDLQSRVVFTSFYHKRVLDARRAVPEARTGVLMSSVPVDIVAVAAAAEAYNVHLHVNRLDEEVVAVVHAAGLRVLAWGVIGAVEQFDRLFELEVDAIGSDWPSRLLARRAEVYGG